LTSSYRAGQCFHRVDRNIACPALWRDSFVTLVAPWGVVRCTEIGLRTKLVPKLKSSVSLFLLDSASEILFPGDAGDTSAGRPSCRYGVEWTNDYRPLPWLSLEGDVAVTHARFQGDDPAQAALYASLAGFPAAQIGNAPGNYIPGAPDMVASAGIRLGEKTGWFAALRYRYFGPRPLTEDDAFVSPATGLLNGQLGYRLDNGWRESSSTRSTCSTAGPTRSPTPTVRCSNRIRCLPRAFPRQEHRPRRLRYARTA
jgi:hypothetical protein